MGNRHQKLVERFCSLPKDFRWNELLRLLAWLGYYPVKGGRTSGSAVRFVHDIHPALTIHRPHPGNIIIPPDMKRILRKLQERGQI